jgi:phosphoglycolate phosphatase
MAMHSNRDRLVIFDADGTTIDAFHAIEETFLRHGMAIGDLDRFQKRRKLFKYLGGLREFPTNLRRQFGTQSRKELLTTLTEVYRDEAVLYPGIAALLRTLLDAPGVRVGLLTRNVTIEPEETLRRLFLRHDIDLRDFDYVACLPLNEDKTAQMKRTRELFAVNPARAYACGDEFGDYRAAIGAGMHPFVVAYGFEDGVRLMEKFGVPGELISTSPADFSARLLNALDLPAVIERPLSAAIGPASPLVRGFPRAPGMAEAVMN